jgi:hypothetical protein
MARSIEQLHQDATRAFLELGQAEFAFHQQRGTLLARLSQVEAELAAAQKAEQPEELKRVIADLRRSLAEVAPKPEVAP